MYIGKRPKSNLFNAQSHQRKNIGCNLFRPVIRWRHCTLICMNEMQYAIGLTLICQIISNQKI